MGQGCKSRRTRYRHGLREATVGLLPPREVLGLLPASDGKTRWTSLLLALCAILISWSNAPTLGDRFEAARGCLLRWYPGRRRPGATYAGFLAALRRRGARLVRRIAEHYRTHVQRLAEARGNWLVSGGWLAFGVDSTKVDAPMTRANERRLGCASRAGSWPQLVLTCVFHLGSGLPWSFLRGHARSSERRHLCGLLATLPAAALLLADAGFTGYDFWRRVTGSGRSFLIRVGSNVRLIEGLGLAVRTYGDGIVWVWPARQQKRHCPPMVLRLITLTDERNRTMYLLTNVLEPARLDDATAARLYAMRWGVEVAFRSLKQTLGRRKLLSDAPRNARAELSWAMIGLWTLLLIKAQRCPRLSLGSGQGVAAVLRVLRRAINDGRRTDITRALAGVRPDAYQRSRPKKARHWPHKKRERPPGKPKARNVTDAELALATELGVIDIAA